MSEKRWWTAAVLALAVLALAALAGCAAYSAGDSFRDPAEDQSTPEGAVQKWLKSYEWKVNPETGQRDPAMGRDFQAWFDVSSPVLFPPDLLPDSDDWDDLAEEWNSQSWEAEFKDLQFSETRYSTGPGGEEYAFISIIGGQVRYIGKEMFGTTEYKIDDFRNKNGQVTLEKINDKWRVIRGELLNEDEYWEVQ